MRRLNTSGLASVVASSRRRPRPFECTFELPYRRLAARLESFGEVAVARKEVDFATAARIGRARHHGRLDAIPTQPLEPSEKAVNLVRAEAEHASEHTAAVRSVDVPRVRYPGLLPCPSVTNLVAEHPVEHRACLQWVVFQPVNAHGDRHESIDLAGEASMP